MNTNLPEKIEVVLYKYKRILYRIQQCDSVLDRLSNNIGGKMLDIQLRNGVNDITGEPFTFEPSEFTDDFVDILFNRLTVIRAQLLIKAKDFERQFSSVKTDTKNA